MLVGRQQAFSVLLLLPCAVLRSAGTWRRVGRQAAGPFGDIIRHRVRELLIDRAAAGQAARQKGGCDEEHELGKAEGHLRFIEALKLDATAVLSLPANS